MYLKQLGKKIVSLGVIIICIHLLLLITGKAYIWKAIWYNFPGIYDHEIFFNNHILASTNPQPWATSANYNKTPLSSELEALHKHIKTTAYVVIKNDSIIQENYWIDGDTSVISNSFSIAKSYVSMLIGFAIQDKYIRSVDQPIGDFLPYFRSEGKEKITIKHLLQMSSGLSWDESYTGPLSITTQGYYGNDLEKLIKGLKVISEPGTEFRYLSGDTQLLGLVLIKATGYSLSEYLHLKFWNPVGAENEALWSTDNLYGREKAFCCISATAKDYARIGKLYLNNGQWNGVQLLNSSYITASLEPNGYFDPQSKTNCDFYGYQWWLIPNYLGHDIFYARGILGQFIICIPEKNIIIVRLGHERGDKKDGIHHIITYAMIDEVLKNF